MRDNKASLERLAKELKDSPFYRSRISLLLVKSCKTPQSFLESYFERMVGGETITLPTGGYRKATMRLRRGMVSLQSHGFSNDISLNELMVMLVQIYKSESEERDDSLSAIAPRAVDSPVNASRTLTKQANMFGRDVKIEVRVDWKIDPENKVGHTFYLTGKIMALDGSDIAMGSIGNLVEDIFPELNGMAHYHRLCEDATTFMTDIMMKVDSPHDGIASALVSLDYVDGERVTIENLCDPKWVEARFKEVVMPNLQKRLRSLKLIIGTGENNER